VEIRQKIIIREKESANIPLKNLVATLSWQKAIDLDLYAFYQTKSGAVGKVFYGSRGSLTSSPYIELDKDAGVGDKGGKNEENIRFADLSHYKHILIVANIFAKANANFAQFGGTVVVKAEDQSFEVPLTAKDGGSWCTIAHIDNTNPISPQLKNVNTVSYDTPKIEEFVKAQQPGGILGRLFGR